MPRFCLINFGCRASQADGSALKRQLLDRGLVEAQDPADSNLTVLNTCTVTASADAEVRQVIRRVHRKNPRCLILVTGCYAQRAPEEIALLPGVRWVVGNSHKHRVTEIVCKSLPGHPGSEHSSWAPKDGRPNLFRIEPSESRRELPAAAGASSPSVTEAENQILVGEIGDEFHFLPAFAEDRTRPTLKIQDGCNARCSFCVIPFVRGRSRSLDPVRIISQVQDLERAGYKEIVLSGINLGTYGRDLGHRITFYGLLELILERTSIPRLRISSIEPMDVSRELIALAASEPRLAQHFHVPLQSGCDRIIRLMSRRYWTAQYAERIFAIRERIPAAGIGADVMAGFPSETDRDHDESLRFIESLPLTYLHVFPYSARPGTRAIAIANPPDGRRVHERCRQIRNLIATKRRRFLMRHVGGTLSLLTLHELNAGARVALSSNFLKAAIPAPAVPENLILDAVVERVEGDIVLCRPNSGGSAASHPAFAEANYRF